MAVLESGVDLVGSLAVELLAAGAEFSLEGVFLGHSMAFLLAVVGTVKPREESSGVFLLFLHGLVVAWSPQGPWVHGQEFPQGGRSLGRDANPTFVELFVLLTGYPCLQS